MTFLNFPDGTRYQAEIRIRPDRIGAEAYTVDHDADGRLRCTCPDFVYRRAADPKKGPCKHGRALVDAGMIPFRPAVEELPRR